MKPRSKLVLIAVSTSAALLGSAGAGLADPATQLISPPNHRHFIVTPNGLVPVGPQICHDPSLHHACPEFHYNVHHSKVPGIGDIATLGPQDGAPGRHNGIGAEVIGVRGCS